jgi:uncharacterized protein YqeY
MRGASADPGQRIKLSTIRLLLSEIKNAEILKKGALSDDEVVDVIQRQVKRRKEAIEQYRKGGREDLAEKEEKEATILSSYLPEQLSDEEIIDLIKEAIKETGATSVKDTGRVMGTLMPKVRGKADGKRVNRLASEILKE